MIEINLNGESKNITSGLNVGQLLDELGVRRHTLMVERNGDLIKRDGFDNESLCEGDVLELIRLTGGG